MRATVGLIIMFFNYQLSSDVDLKKIFQKDFFQNLFQKSDSPGDLKKDFESIFLGIKSIFESENTNEINGNRGESLKINAIWLKSTIMSKIRRGASRRGKKKRF